MKISHDLRSKVERKPVPKKFTTKRNFEAIVQSKAQNMQREQLEQLLEDITEQGKKVVRYRSFRDLARFKRMIKQFIEEAVYKGMSVKETHNFNMTNFSHQLITVEKIDEKLIQLTENILDQEKKAVDLLAIIGEIEGLLINLYM